MYDLAFIHAPSLYDFRTHPTLWGPISDLVPSTPVFDMYPIGFSTMLAHLKKKGYSVTIENLAAQMVKDRGFDAEKAIKKLDAKAYATDLHWLPHAQGALEVAKLVKRYHPGRPTIFGGYSSSYFHEELAGHDYVDYVVRGDSGERPLEQLMGHIMRGTEPVDVYSLTWKNKDGIHVNPMAVPGETLDELALDYTHMVAEAAKSALKSMFSKGSFSKFLPFADWETYPIMAALSVKGCSLNCTFCGGSAYAGKNVYNRSAPSYRSPERLAKDVKMMGSISKAPVFILGDIRQAGKDYAERFIEEIDGFDGAVILELFRPADAEFMDRVSKAMPDFYIEFTPESLDPEVRKGSHKAAYSNIEIEETIAACLGAGAKRFDIFFMIGLQRQTEGSIFRDLDGIEALLEKFPDGRLIPFISPLAPFLDPGSIGYEHHAGKGYENGYIRRAFTLEDHARLLTEPTWKDILSYRTRNLSRDDIARLTYTAGKRLNRMKEKYGIVSPEMADETEWRINEAVSLMQEIDQLRAELPEDKFWAEMEILKPRIDRANTSTVCDKSELNVKVGKIPFKIGNISKLLLEELIEHVRLNTKD